MKKNSVLIPPYGGKLVNLVTTGAEREALREEANHYPSIQISDRALHDLELLAIGGYSPLDRFMGKADYQRVLTEMRLADGTLFPMPITLTIKKEDLPTNSEWVAIRELSSQPDCSDADGRSIYMGPSSGTAFGTWFN